MKTVAALLLCFLGLALLCLFGFGCSSYRLEWQGLGKRPDGKPSAFDPKKERSEIFREKVITPTPETAWIAWKTQHDSLEHAMSRRTREAPLPATIFQACRDMLALLDRHYPDHGAQIEEARQTYTTVEGRARTATAPWSQRKLESLRRSLESIRRTKTEN